MACRVYIDEADWYDAFRAVQGRNVAVVIADRDQLARIEQQIVAGGQKVGVVEDGGPVVDEIVVLLVFGSEILDQRSGHVVLDSQLELQRQIGKHGS